MKRPGPSLALLLILAAILAVLAGQVGFDLPWLRVPAGLFFTLVAPGYALLRVLQPGHLSRLTRIILSVPLSLAIAIIAGIILDMTSFGVRPQPMTLALSGITLVLVGTAWARGTQREAVVNTGTSWDWLRIRRPRNILALTAMSIMTVLAGIWALVGFSRALQEHPLPFTELYIGAITGPTSEGQIQAAFRIGVHNQEQRAMAYDLQIISLPPNKPAEVQAERRIDVAAGERWEEALTVDIACDDIVEVVLRLPGQTTSYRRVQARPPCATQPEPSPAGETGRGQSDQRSYDLIRTTPMRSEDSART